MPTYVFKDSNTDEIVEHSMSYTVLDEFLATNPHLLRYHSPENLPVFSDAMRMNVPGTKTCDPTFEREVIGRIKEKVPGNTVKAGHKTKAPRLW